jgi:hypothetical protein
MSISQNPQFGEKTKLYMSSANETDFALSKARFVVPSPNFYFDTLGLCISKHNQQHSFRYAVLAFQID